jgi:hypothetical protein
MNQRVIKKILESIGIYDPTVVGNGKVSKRKKRTNTLNLQFLFLLLSFLLGSDYGDSESNIRCDTHGLDGKRVKEENLVTSNVFRSNLRLLR